MKRELLEEAAATVVGLQRLGVQNASDPLIGESFQSFYWCRVTLAKDFTPEHEITERVLVTPEQFLAILFWNQHDSKGEMLLKRALALNHLYA